MTAYEMMLSESQERMLAVLKPGREAEAERIFRKWELDFAVIGMTTDTNRLVIDIRAKWSPTFRCMRCPTKRRSMNAPIKRRKPQADLKPGISQSAAEFRNLCSSCLPRPIFARGAGCGSNMIIP